MVNGMAGKTYEEKLAEIGLDSLKGQCHEMVVEVRPWSGSLALN
jgi:hypothetical protein